MKPAKRNVINMLWVYGAGHMRSRHEGNAQLGRPRSE